MQTLLPSDRRKPNNVYDYESAAISVNQLWDPFGRIIVLLPDIKVKISFLIEFYLIKFKFYQNFNQINSILIFPFKDIMY